MSHFISTNFAKQDYFESGDFLYTIWTTYDTILNVYDRDKKMGSLSVREINYPITMETFHRGTNNPSRSNLFSSH